MMSRTALATASANIALVKYWGKRPGSGNLPATPSLSLTLDTLVTTTRVSFSSEDTVVLNGETAQPDLQKRVASFLDIWRERGLLRSGVRVETHNEFPTGAGLASSASGFAALTRALAGLCGWDDEPSAYARIARLGSASSARSMFGGFVAFPTGDDPVPECIVPETSVRWGMVVAVVESGPKEITSREGMILTAKTSPYYGSWIETAAADYDDAVQAVVNEDLHAVGEIAEANAIAMHATALSARPALLYWRGTTVELLRRVRLWRNEGLAVYATIDAGPNVAFLTELDSLDILYKKATEVPGVQSVISAQPGPGARLLEAV
jgi:diphosphomevalonate decarboxylase